MFAVYISLMSENGDIDNRTTSILLYIGEIIYGYKGLGKVVYPWASAVFHNLDLLPPSGYYTSTLKIVGVINYLI